MSLFEMIYNEEAAAENDDDLLILSESEDEAVKALKRKKEEAKEEARKEREAKKRKKGELKKQKYRLRQGIKVEDASSGEEDNTEKALSQEVVPTIQRLQAIYMQKDTEKVERALYPRVRKPKPAQVEYAIKPNRANPFGKLASGDVLKERLAKRARRAEWQKMSEYWRRRRAKFQEEEDVGGAITRALQRAEQERREEETAAEQERQEQDGDGGFMEDRAVGESSEEEEAEDAVFQQLTQQSQEENVEAKKDNEAKRKYEIFTSYKERLDFFEQGKTVPNDQSAKLTYYKFLSEAPPPSFHDSEIVVCGDHVTLKNATISIRKADKVDTSALPQLTHMSPCASSFAPKVQIQRLAARYLLGRRAVSPQMWQMIRFLWDSAMNKHTRNSIVRTLCVQNAIRHDCFYGHVWKDRSEMAQRLGADRNAPHPLVGYRVDYETHHKRFEQTAIQRLIRLFHRKKIRPDWSETCNRPAANKTIRRIMVDMRPTTTYFYIPGTAPPVIPGPLDESGIVLGQPDLFSRHLSRNNWLNESTWRVSFAALLSMYSNAHNKGSERIPFIRQQMQVMAWRAVDTYKKVNMRRVAFDDDFPVTHLFRSYMWLFSMNLNVLLNSAKRGSLGRLRSSQATTQSDAFNFISQWTQEDDGDESRENEQFSVAFDSVQGMARDLLQIYTGVIENHNLDRFGDFHMMRGILLIAKTLPERAARRFVRPFDDTDCPTPFHLMRSVVQYMEEKQMIKTKVSNNNQKGVSVFALEHSFHQVNEVFAQCVERHPSELKYHCWHLATLAASLVVSSGNRIGSPAHLSPSTKTKVSGLRELEAFTSEPTVAPVKSEPTVAHHHVHVKSEPTVAQHHVRVVLPKFDSVRRATVRTLYLMLRLVAMQKQQDTLRVGSNYHLAVISMLEWSQAMGLVIGTRSNYRERLETIHNIHNHHHGMWKLSGPDCADLVKSHLDRSMKIEAAASVLERDPSKKEHWRNLALLLGPVGQLRSPEWVKVDAASAILVPGRVIDRRHVKDLRRKKSWWGRVRRKWWDTSVFNFEELEGYYLPEFYHLPIIRNLSAALKTVEPLDPVIYEVTNENKGKQMKARYKELLRFIDSEQLDGKANTGGDDDDDNLKKEEQDARVEDVCVESLLPQREGFVRTETTETEPTSQYLPFPESTPARDQLEVACYRIVIAYHLFGGDQKSFTWIVHTIMKHIMRTWDHIRREFFPEKDDFTALQWLCQMGVSATAVATWVHQTNLRSPVRAADQFDSVFYHERKRLRSQAVTGTGKPEARSRGAQTNQSIDQGTL